MADVRLVQCFGLKRRPHKEDKICRRRFMWTAAAGGKHHFGRRGTQACPHCGCMPNLAHPYNRYLGGELTMDEAEAAMPGFREQVAKDNANQK